MPEHEELLHPLIMVDSKSAPVVPFVAPHQLSVATCGPGIVEQLGQGGVRGLCHGQLGQEGGQGLSLVQLEQGGIQGEVIPGVLGLTHVVIII